jgi:hypothetical protein
VPAEPPAVAGDAARGEFDGSGGWPGVVANNAGQTALLVYTFAVLVAPAILSGYHFQLIHRARTTNEDIRRVWQGKVNPHDNGLLSNCLDVLWAPTPPSHLLPRLDVLTLEPDDPVTTSCHSSASHLYLTSPCHHLASPHLASPPSPQLPSPHPTYVLGASVKNEIGARE